LLQPIVWFGVNANPAILGVDHAKVVAGRVGSRKIGGIIAGVRFVESCRVEYSIWQFSRVILSKLTW
jgi:hypothetical protein